MKIIDFVKLCDLASLWQKTIASLPPLRALRETIRGYSSNPLLFFPLDINITKLICSIFNQLF